ncbi:hypothetical protein QZH41_008159 [Actinostola sp. cb2023]|nr:hypothetical protein QZH41_008159 [Actinostola sp. cb2023]
MGAFPLVWIPAFPVKTLLMFVFLLRRDLIIQGVVTAAYLPLRIQLNPKTKCLQPTPIKNAKWIIACSPEDKACLRSTE